MSAETQTNWMPRTLGPMMLRPGLGYITSTYSDAKARVVPFIFSSTDYAALEFTAGILRVLVDDDPITRVSVTSTLADFTSAPSWTLATSGGGTSVISSNKLTLNLVSSGGVATATQMGTLGIGDGGKVHAVRVVVERGPVKFRVGTTSGGDDYITTTTLDTGTHSLAFTPSADFYVQFEGVARLNKIVSSCTIEAAGVMTLTTPYTVDDLSLIRTEQSADVVFIACEGYQQRKIERRGTYSWSFVEYKTDNGPFNFNSDTAVSITPGAVSGNTTLTASRPLFKSTHVGALFELDHGNMDRDADASAVVRQRDDRLHGRSDLHGQHDHELRRHAGQLHCLVSDRLQGGCLWVWHGGHLPVVPRRFGHGCRAHPDVQLVHVGRCRGAGQFRQLHGHVRMARGLMVHTAWLAYVCSAP